VTRGPRPPRGRLPDGRPLTWNVATLLAEPTGSTRDYRIDGATVALPDELRLADPIEGAVRLARTNRGLIVTADLTTAIEAQCSRCLRDIVVPLTLRVDEEALPSVDLDSGLPVDAGSEPDVLRLTDHHELDLEPVVADAISLAEPIAPLCRPDCKGLCPTCGQSLEEGDHRHEDDEIDPRLAALRGFRAADTGAADETAEADDVDTTGAGSPGSGTELNRVEVDGRGRTR
jgi:uncharacterized protein